MNISSEKWFDPKNPPKTPIYVGKRIPIYIVPDDTADDDRLPNPIWKKTNWVFRIVEIHQTEGNEDVVDVEWPNGYIDINIPVSLMYGHFSRLKRSWVSKFT